MNPLLGLIIVIVIIIIAVIIYKVAFPCTTIYDNKLLLDLVSGKFRINDTAGVIWFEYVGKNELDGAPTGANGAGIDTFKLRTSFGDLVNTWPWKFTLHTLNGAVIAKPFIDFSISPVYIKSNISKYGDIVVAETTAGITLTMVELEDFKQLMVSATPITVQLTRMRSTISNVGFAAHTKLADADANTRAAAQKDVVDRALDRAIADTRTRVIAEENLTCDKRIKDVEYGAKNACDARVSTATSEAKTACDSRVGTLSSTYFADLASLRTTIAKMEADKLATISRLDSCNGQLSAVNYKIANLNSGLNSCISDKSNLTRMLGVAQTALTTCKDSLAKYITPTTTTTALAPATTLASTSTTLALAPAPTSSTLSTALKTSTYTSPPIISTSTVSPW